MLILLVSSTFDLISVFIERAALEKIQRNMRVIKVTSDQFIAHYPWIDSDTISNRNSVHFPCKWLCNKTDPASGSDCFFQFRTMPISTRQPN